MAVASVRAVDRGDLPTLSRVQEVLSVPNEVAAEVAALAAVCSTRFFSGYLVERGSVLGVRRALALLPLALLLVTAPGCGSQDALDLDPVANAASKTSEAGSSRVAFKTTMVGDGETISFGGEGIFSYDEVHGSMTMDMSSLSGEDGGRVEIRMLGTMVYMRIPESLSAGLPQGKQWMAMDLGKSLDAAMLGGLDPSQLMQQDPTQTLKLLRASSSDIEEAGKADVRGTETTRYTAMLDLKKSFEASADELGLTEQQRQEARTVAEELKKQAGVEAVPIEVFVDDDGLLRRMVMKISFVTEGEKVSMEQLSDYYDFGVEVDVEAPPASQVFDLSGAVGASRSSPLRLGGMQERVRWARALEAIARSGLTYSESAFDRERFAAVRSIAAEIAADASGEDATVLEARFADEYGYATPKIDVRGVVLGNRGLLLVRERGETRWTLPGGWADVGDTLRQAVQKEVREEAGLDVSALRVLAVYDRDFRGRTRGRRTSTSCTCAATSSAASRRGTGSRRRRRRSSRSTGCRSCSPKRRPSSCAPCSRSRPIQRAAPSLD